MIERRKSPRIVISTVIKIGVEKIDDIKEFFSKDLSGGGVFIYTSEPLPVGTNVALEISILEGSINIIEAEGKVVWCVTTEQIRSGAAPGMAVKFTSIDPESQAIIDTLVKEHFGSESKGVVLGKLDKD